MTQTTDLSLAPTSDITRTEATSMRRFRLAVLAGVTVLAAAPPFNLWPLAPLSVALVFLAVDGASLSVGVGAAWLAGFVANIGGYHWAVGLMQHYGGMSLPRAVAATVLLCAGQALVWVAWSGIAHAASRFARAHWLVTAPLAIIVAERFIPLIFPWYLGVTLWKAWPLVQLAEFGGPSIVSAWIVLVGITCASAWKSKRASRSIGRETRLAAGVAFALLCVGWLRAGMVAFERREAKPLVVGIVEPRQALTGASARALVAGEQVRALNHATEELGRQGAELVVWPETSFGYLFDRNLNREFGPGHPWTLRGEYQGSLVFGSLTHSFGDSATVRNSALLVERSGNVSGVYDKRRLLVFGEYVPFAETFPNWAKKLRSALPDLPPLEPGERAKPLVSAADGLRLGTMICYEDLFPSASTELAKDEPNLLVTLANHAWFGTSSAGEQAMALSTFRAIETRRDFVRATNTGVSSAVDAYGRVLLAGPQSSPSTDGVSEPATYTTRVLLSNARSLGPSSIPYAPYVALVLLASSIAFTARRRRRAH